MKNYLYVISIKLFLILSLSIIFISCSKDDIPESKLEIRGNLIYQKGDSIPFTGHEKARTQNKIIEYDVVNGIKHGDFMIYYDDGTLEMKGQLDSSRNVGRWQYFYENGKLESAGDFVIDKPEGRWVWYYQNGKTKEEGDYRQGNRVGLWTQYDTDGKVILKKDFEEGDSVNAEENPLIKNLESEN